MNSKPDINAEIEKVLGASSSQNYKRAHSIGGVKIVTQKDVDDVLQYASNLQRAREPILVHENFDEIPQRFINCLHGTSYVRPHMHVVPNQWELMCWISGEIKALIFDEKGIVIRKILMNENNVKLIEIPPFCYHSFIAIDNGSYLEVRNCKYQPLVDRVYSTWSPSEDDINAKLYQERLSVAELGDQIIV